MELTLFNKAYHTGEPTVKVIDHWSHDEILIDLSIDEGSVLLTESEVWSALCQLHPDASRMGQLFIDGGLKAVLDAAIDSCDLAE